MNDEGKLQDLKRAACNRQIAKGDLLIALTAIRIWDFRHREKHRRLRQP